MAPSTAASSLRASASSIGFATCGEGGGPAVDDCVDVDEWAQPDNVNATAAANASAVTRALIASQISDL
jgi:hypothetical protein